ncbi:MAG: hypothetical protein J0H74_28835 [Chitinophagaceae bacterium]|nr:hypothetical protein [Chitinophagaceae bacterium]
MRHNKDILWKGLLEMVLDDLLRFVFPNADQVFDLQREFGFLDRELAEIFPQRMFRYFYRCFDRYRKPVAAITIYTGPDGRRLPNCYEYELMHISKAKAAGYFNIFG